MLEGQREQDAHHRLEEVVVEALLDAPGVDQATAPVRLVEDTMAAPNARAPVAAGGELRILDDLVGEPFAVRHADERLEVVRPWPATSAHSLGIDIDAVGAALGRCRSRTACNE